MRSDTRRVRDGGTRCCARGDRAGFAAIAAVIGIVAIGLIGTLAVLPLVETIAAQERVEETYEFLVSLTDAPKQGLQKFMTDVGAAPGRMTDLSEAIGGNDDDVCGDNYGNGGANEWQPVSPRIFIATGVPTRLGIISNQLTHIDDGALEYVALPITGVLLEDAQRMDVMVDNPTGATTGRVRWITTDAAQELVTLQWLVPMTPC